MQTKRIIDILKTDNVGISCELFPPKQGTELQNSLEIVNKIAQVHPSYMSVTYGAGGSTVGYSAALAKEVQDNDIPALAHLTCVKADEEKIKGVLDQLKSNGIENILALRGDIPAGMEKDAIGKFAHASDLMSFIKEQGDFCVGGAAYPEGHPESGSLANDIENTKYKVEAGVDFLVTQMFFDNRRFFDFVDRVREAGITVPVIPGIKPLTTLGHQSLLPKTFHIDFPAELVSEWERCRTNDDVKQLGVEWAIAQARELKEAGVPSIHFYSMNATSSVEKIARAVY